MKAFIFWAILLPFSYMYAQTLTFSTGDWEPYVGEIMVEYGPSARVVTEACKRAGYTCEFDFMPWKRAWETAKHGKVHGTFLWSYSEERAQEMMPSSEVVGWSRIQAFYNRKKFPHGLDIKSFQEAGKYSVVGVREYYQTLQMQKLGINVHIVNNSSLAYKMLALQRTDLYLENPLVATTEIGLMIPEYQDDIVKSPSIIDESKMYIFFSRIHPESLEAKNKLDTALKAMHEEGLVESIYQEKHIMINTEAKE